MSVLAKSSATSPPTDLGHRSDILAPFCYRQDQFRMSQAPVTVYQKIDGNRRRVMDMGFVAATMARARADDAGRYEGCVMFSALPGAPVVEHRRGFVKRLRDGAAAMKARGRTK
jgi:hypothetical protein